MKIKAQSQFEFDKQPRLMLAAFRLIATKNSFLREFRPILDPEHWSEMELKWLVAQCVEHWDNPETGGVAPKFPVLRMRLDADRNITDEQHQLVTRILNKMEDIEVDLTTRDYVRQHFEAFIQYRATLRAVHEAQQLVLDGDNDAAVEVVRKSQQVRRRETAWVTLPQDADSFFDIFNEDAIKAASLPTGLEPVDKHLGGGLRKGELGVWVAPTGYGKSMALVHCGAEAFQLGKTVVHFTFENSEEETLARYMYNLLSTESGVLPTWNKVHPRYLERKAEMEAFKGTLKIMELVGSETTAQDLMSYLDDLEQHDIIPDLVIVDYGDYMRAARPSTRQSKKYEELQSVFEELRDLAAKRDVALWTATQANREGLKGKRVLTHHIADSLGKAMVADIMLSISMEVKDRAGKAISVSSFSDDDDDDVAPESEHRILHLLKLRRSGSDNWWIKVKAHYSQAKFELEDWAEPDEEKLAKATTDKRLKSRRKKVGEDE